MGDVMGWGMGDEMGWTPHLATQVARPWDPLDVGLSVPLQVCLDSVQCRTQCYDQASFQKGTLADIFYIPILQKKFRENRTIIVP
jgi:hypothetical protein